MSKHTPGPWTVHNFLDGGTMGEVGLYEVEEAHYSIRDSLEAGDNKKADEEAAANTRLISASPELLSAAQSLLFFVESFKDQHEELDAAEVYRRIEAAIPTYQVAIARAVNE